MYFPLNIYKKEMFIHKMVNQKEIADKWQKKWKESKLFEKEKEEKEKFFITTPYPYISGSLHIGHGRSVAETDIYARYKRMKGYNVLFPLGFHITGTPVLGISAAIENGDEKTIKTYKKYVSAYVEDREEIDKIIESFKDPQKVVDFFIPKMIEEYTQLGLSVDWRRSFTTGDMSHQQMVTWQFKKYKELGYLKQGEYPVLYCPQDGNAMGEDDIKDADSDSVEKQEWTLLKFELDGKYLIAATLRPETVYGQTNLWINPEVKYYDVKVGSETWVMCEKAAWKLSYQRNDVEIKDETEDLIGKKTLAPGLEKEIVILPGPFVDPDRGTGIVTSVPSDAPFDYTALKDLKKDEKVIEKYKLDSKEIENIEVIPIIKTKKYGDKAGPKAVEENDIENQHDERLTDITEEVYREGFHKGIMMETCGEFKGMTVPKAKEAIKKKLIQEDKASTFFETSRKAYSRSGGEVIVAVLDDQWFIDFNSEGWKEKAYKVLENTELKPESYRKNFEETFEWLDKRPCARKRGLGTKFPFNTDWIIESLSDSTIYMSLYTINHIVKKNNLQRENLNDSFFDYVFKRNIELEQASDETGVSKEILKKCRESFEYWSPNDHRHTFELHLSNHLSFMMFAHAALLPDLHPRKISFHGLVMSEGGKMSKSKGNTVTLLDIKKYYGPDIFRFYMTNSTTIESTFDWQQKEAESAKKTVEKLFEEIQEAISNRKEGAVGSIYKSKYNRIVKEATLYLEEMKLREYNHRSVFEMMQLVRHARNNLEEDDLKAFYNYIVEGWIKLISPVTPHIAEELWEKYKGEGFVSEAPWPEYDEELIDEKSEYIDSLKEDLKKDISEVLELAKVENPKKMTFIISPKWKYEFMEFFREKIKETRDQGIITKELMSKKSFKKHGKEAVKLIQDCIKHPNKIPKHSINQEEEKHLLEKNKKQISNLYNLEIEIILAEDSNHGKAKSALPGKPALIVE